MGLGFPAASPGRGCNAGEVGLHRAGGCMLLAEQLKVRTSFNTTQEESFKT